MKKVNRLKHRGSAYAKDVRREMKRSLGRFLSIFLIVALGTGFFAGIKSTMPDMKESAAEFFEENRLMDLKLMSTVGFQYEDLQAIEKLDGISGVSAGYSCDVYYNYDGQNQVVKIMSYNLNSDPESESFLNRPILLEGRMPEKSGECVVEVTMKTPGSYKIGEELTFLPPGDDIGMGELFVTDTYTVVGIVASPLYIGFERDTTTIGNGTVNSFVLVPEDDFVIGSYTELYVRFADLEETEPFSDEYTDLVESRKTEVIEAVEASVGKRFEETMENARSQLESAEKKLKKAERLLKLSDAELAAYRNELSAGIDRLEAKKLNALDRIDLKQKRAELEKLDAVLAGRKSGDSTAEEKMREEVQRSRAELEAAKAKLDSAPAVRIYDFSRFSSSDYASYADDSEKIDAISKVFPVFFVFIAALVCLTTMTRMVDEKRIEIGTYKAMGYSSGKIIAKYLIYALVPTVCGALSGMAIGFRIFPSIIYNAYRIIYNMPSISTPFRMDYAAWCLLTAVVCIGAAVTVSCYKTLKAQPSELMRPKSPPAGKRVFLERLPKIWSRLGFLTKVTVRNLLRYKKRFVMTIVGVAGCCALIMTGFGIKHSISEIADLQFNEIFRYDAVAVINGDCEGDAGGTVGGFEGVKDVLQISENDCILTFGEKSEAAALVIPEDTEKLKSFVSLRDCRTGDEVFVEENAVVITEKVAQLLSISKGDRVTIGFADGTQAHVRVSAVVENYAMHYIYISPATYERLFGSGQRYNQILLQLEENADRTALSEEIIRTDEILGMLFMSDKAESFFSSIESLNAIVWLLIVCAALLAFIVLYNLANININERVREIATLKVLGFFDGETSAYIYRENILTTAIGIVIGWGAGLVLHRFVIRTAEIDVVMFARDMVWYGYLLSALLTVAFTVIVNVALHFRLKKVDMVESLKSIE